MSLVSCQRNQSTGLLVCISTEHFGAKLRSVGEPPWILSGSFRDRKMQEEFAATQAEMQRPGLPVTVVGVCHGPCDLSPSKIPRFQRRYPSAILSCFCKYCN